MAKFEIIKCHGSGNDFILVDTTRLDSNTKVEWEEFARVACDRTSGIGSDGVLLLVGNHHNGFGMDMLNPDGTHAEMCGNGIRCVARLAFECGYMDSSELLSGGRVYRVERTSNISEDIATIAVDVPIRTESPSFGFAGASKEFIGQRIDSLDPKLRFTALNLGNPHIVACTEDIDMQHLEHLGRRILSLKEDFPDGINLSFYKVLSKSSIFVATYERGAGITLSCGTAMTASATAAALLDYVNPGKRIEVLNRGGKVYCTTAIYDHRITTRLEGNATFEWWGEAEFGDGKPFSYTIDHPTGEAERWQEFVAQLNK